MRLTTIIAAFLIAPLMTPVVFMVFDLVQGHLLLIGQLPFYFLAYAPFAYLAISRNQRDSVSRGRMVAARPET